MNEKMSIKEAMHIMQMLIRDTQSIMAHERQVENREAWEVIEEDIEAFRNFIE
jgi:hypothetical protein